MAGVASKQLGITVTASAVWSTIYTPPANFVTILKSIYYVVPATGGANLQVRLMPAGGTNALVLALVASPTVNTPYGWTGWLVMNPGDQLEGYASGAIAVFWASGAELSTAPPA